MQSTQSNNAMENCKICFQKIEKDSIHSLLSNNVAICNSCFNKFSILDKTINILGVKCFILFEYNEFMKEQIYKLKGCGDIEIAPVFLSYRLSFLKLKYHNFHAIPAPSNQIDDERRGFNHVIEIYKTLNLETDRIIRKTEVFKQSDFDKKEREKIVNKLEIIDGEKITGKNVLIVDDIITTGSTLKACISLIKKYNPKRIEALVIAHPKQVNT